jgi:hypothetical protein
MGGQIGDGKGDRTEGAIPLVPGVLRSHPGSPAQGVSPFVAWSAPISGPTRGKYGLQKHSACHSNH